jgi:hypothetical protein
MPSLLPVLPVESTSKIMIILCLPQMITSNELAQMSESMMANL